MSRAELVDGGDSSKGDGVNVVSKARNLMSGDAQFFSSQADVGQLRKQLDSDSLSQKKEAMKRIVAQIALGQNMAALFPDVVKNIHVASIELRKLIYYFIVHYSEERPNEALLSISAFQQDLIDQSMHVRALSLRTLSNIRISSISPVVLVAIKKCSTDLSPIVRRTAAIALAKMHRNSRDDTAASVPVIGQLLGDRSMEVVGAVAGTFLQICPDRLDLIHKQFRRICRGLQEAEEWGQINLINLLLRYARDQFIDPCTAPKKAAKKSTADSDDSASDSDSDDEDDVFKRTLEMDSDHRLLLTSVKPLLSSLNRGVVMAAVSLFFHCAPEAELDVCTKPLLRILNGDPSGHYVALMALQTFIHRRPRSFVPYIRDFYVVPQDAPATRALRLRLLAKLVTKDNMNATITELRSYLRSYDVEKVVDAIKAFGLVTYTLSDSTPTVIKHMIPLLAHPSDKVITETVLVLRQLVVQSADKTQTCQIVQKLASRVLRKTVTAPSAVASIIWLVGENIRTHPTIAKIAPDFFRLFVKTFPAEHSAVKLHVIILGLKIWLNLTGEGELADRFKALFFHLLELVKYDADCDIRDQGRLVQTALNRDSDAFTALHDVTLAAKPLPQHNEGARTGVTVGSMSQVVGSVLPGYRALDEWKTEQPDPSVREPVGEGADSSSYASSSGSSSSDDSSSDADSDESESSSASSDSSNSSASSAPAPPRARAPVVSAVKVKVVSKVVTKPGAAPAAGGPNRVVDELFAKKATTGTSPQQATKHADPASPARPFTPCASQGSVSVAVRVEECEDRTASCPVTVRLTNTHEVDDAMVEVHEDADEVLGGKLLKGFGRTDLESGTSVDVRVVLRFGEETSLTLPLDIDNKRVDAVVTLV